jgi:hypothetical protein
VRERIFAALGAEVGEVAQSVVVPFLQALLASDVARTGVELAS